jgi:hypothetical protein
MIHPTDGGRPYVGLLSASSRHPSSFLQIGDESEVIHKTTSVSGRRPIPSSLPFSSSAVEIR